MDKFLVFVDHTPVGGVYAVDKFDAEIQAREHWGPSSQVHRAVQLFGQWTIQL